MTYRGDLDLSVELADLEISYSGNFATKDYMNFSVRNNNITGLSVSGDTISFPAGSFLVKAMIGADRTLASDDFTYQLELDGSLVGNLGQTETSSSQKTGVDHVAFAFDLESTGSLKLKIVSATASSWTVNSAYCYVLIIRSV